VGIKGGGRKEKGPRFKARESDSKTTDQKTPVFCLHHLGGDYCLSNCDKDHKAAFADKLNELSKQRWQNLKLAPRHGSGYEKISREEIKTRIPPEIPEDAQFIAFRFFGRKPFVGYRNQEVLHVLWIDRNFTLYDHG